MDGRTSGAYSEACQQFVSPANAGAMKEDGRAIMSENLLSQASVGRSDGDVDDCCSCVIRMTPVPMAVASRTEERVICVQCMLPVVPSGRPACLSMSSMGRFQLVICTRSSRCPLEFLHPAEYLIIACIAPCAHSAAVVVQVGPVHPLFCVAVEAEDRDIALPVEGWGPPL